MIKTLLQNHREKEEKEFWLLSLDKNGFIFFILIILFLPTQFGRHFWPSYSYVLGIRVDYLSPTLYVTDVCIFLLFLSTVFPRVRNVFKHPSKIHWKYIVGGLLLIISILLSKSPQVGFYGFIKILEFSFFGYYVAHLPLRMFKTFSTRTIILWTFSVGIIFESILSIFQFWLQRSIGGMFYFLGERSFSGQTLGIANASLHGELILRPYGTFSHPNVLAGYLLLTIIFILFFKKYERKKTKRFLTYSIVVGTVGLFSTLSRIPIVAYAIIIGGYVLFFWGKTIRVKKTAMIILAIAVLFFLGPLLYFRFSSMHILEESLQERLVLARAAISMFGTYPVTGVGIGNFLIQLPLFFTSKTNVFLLQPAHNIFLLILAETGIIGFACTIVFFFTLFKRLIKNSQKPLVVIISLILFLGLFDHYFLTLQQGQLLFSFFLGLCYNPSILKYKL